MRTQPGRTKKLIVAFHFQFANQAAWKCDDCRASGLEGKRHCGWIPEYAGGGERPVWVRNGVAVTTCPVSHISAQSLAWVEEFAAWKALGGVEPRQLAARTVEAFCILEAEVAKEARDGER